MFDSGITARTLIDEIQSEADIAPAIPEINYIHWLNGLERLLYSEIIREQKKSNLDLTPSLVDFALAHPEMKLNLWPLFDSQRIGEYILDVSEDGTYTLRVDNEWHTSDTGAFFEKKITLRQGTYTLSDNAEEFIGDMSATLKRIYITNAEDGTELASLSYHAYSQFGSTFTLEEDTEVVLHIRALYSYDYGANGRTFQPQLELGIDKTPEFIPPASVAFATDVPVIVCDLPMSTTGAQVRFEDIHAVYVGSTQMIKSTLASGYIFPDTYFREENQLGLHFAKMPKDPNVTIIHTMRPKLKTPENIATTNVMLPLEFIDLAKAKLRGEAYKLANEAGLAAVWLNDYNVLLETFKAWIAGKQPEFGL